jgi:hypothetical protein
MAGMFKVQNPKFKSSSKRQAQINSGELGPLDLVFDLNFELWI